jgi:hypothetical protein
MASAMMLRDEFPVHKNRTWRWVMMVAPEVEKGWGRGLAWRVMGMPSQGSTWQQWSVKKPTKLCMACMLAR